MSARRHSATDARLDHRGIRFAMSKSGYENGNSDRLAHAAATNGITAG